MTALILSSSSQDLAEVLQEVSETLLGISPSTTEPQASTKGLDSSNMKHFSIALLKGEQRFDVVLSCKVDDAISLTSHMTGKAKADVDQKLTDDALSEWLNIIAGQLKSLNALDHALGLPSAVPLEGDATRLAEGLSLHFNQIPATLWVGIRNASFSDQNRGGS